MKFKELPYEYKGKMLPSLHERLAIIKNPWSNYASYFTVFKS